MLLIIIYCDIVDNFSLDEVINNIEILETCIVFGIKLNLSIYYYEFEKQRDENKIKIKIK